jgi:hypothetical protein
MIFAAELVRILVKWRKILIALKFPGQGGR